MKEALVSEDGNHKVERLARLEKWLKQAELDGRVAPGTIGAPILGQLAGREERLTSAEIAKRPHLAEFADELEDLLASTPASQTPNAPISHFPSKGRGAPLPASETASAARPADPPVTPTTTVSDPTEHLSRQAFQNYRGGVPDRPAARVEIEEPAGSLLYRWAAHPDPDAIYAVVVNDENRSLSPDDGRFVGVTRNTELSDNLLPVNVVRHVQVWVTTQGSREEASTRQPQLWAESSRVTPVAGVDMKEQYGLVFARWKSPEGARAVRVYRMAPDEARDPSAHHLTGTRIQPDEGNLYGTTDSNIEPGTEYVYRIIVEADTGAESTPVDWPLITEDKIRAVEGLTCTVQEVATATRPGRVTLTWPRSLTGQEIRIFRTRQQPGPGALGRVYEEGALEQMGFTDAVFNPPEPAAEPGMDQMRSVPWPPGWTKAYFTPVSVLRGQVLAGPSAIAVGVPAPGDPILVDRVHEQIVSVVWPEGAGSVSVHYGPRGADPEQVCQGDPAVQVDRVAYVRAGGLRLELPPDREQDIFLCGWVGGHTRSRPVVVQRPGQLHVRYSVHRVAKLMGLGGIQYLKIVTWVDGRTQPGSPPFVVVVNDKRIPLHPGDGTVLTCVPDDTPDARPQSTFKPVTLSGGPTSPAYRALSTAWPKRGYVRVFLSPSVRADERARICVLDPSIDSLRWG